MKYLLIALLALTTVSHDDRYDDDDDDMVYVCTDRGCDWIFIYD